MRLWTAPVASPFPGGSVFRIVPSRFPTQSLFETATSIEDVELLAELEGLTNSRLRHELGDIRLLPAGESVFGPGTTAIMAAFCHPAPSRFTDGSYGVYYAARSVTTAIRETVYHRERWLREAGNSIGPETLEMRCYSTQVLKRLITVPVAERPAILDKDSYLAARAWAREERAHNAWGIWYPSVRDENGQCVAIFRPKALSPAIQNSHYRYFWDGQCISGVEQFSPIDLH